MTKAQQRERAENAATGFVNGITEPAALLSITDIRAFAMEACGSNTKGFNEAMLEMYRAKVRQLVLARRNEIPEVHVENRRGSIERQLEWILSSAEADLAKFAASFAENPFYAFEWAQSAIEAAARKDVATRLKMMIDGGKEKDSYDGWEAAVAFAYDQALRGARWPNHSTSAVSNVAKEALTAAYADFAANFPR